MIPPRDLEGSTTNGAIFILVTDSHNNPVQGANVHVENTTTLPYIIIDDITDKNGYLRIVDVPTGSMSYQISVTKEGYSMDTTMASSTDNPNPTERNITVLAQQVSDVFSTIDILSSLTVHALNESCEPLDGRFTMKGDKLIGTPDIRKYDKQLQTDTNGNLDLTNLDFDNYSFFVANGYDLAGSIPMVPYNLAAGAHGDVTLIFAPHTPNSLLVRAVDDTTNLPLSDATVTLRRGGYTSAQKTNYGFISQTDWSGGPGQTTFSDLTPNMYDNDFQVDTLTSPGNVILASFAGHYLTPGSVGTLDSSVFDIGKKVDLKTIEFTSESMPPEAGDDAIQMQIAMSNSSTGADLSNFVGPDGTSMSYFSSTSTLINTGGITYRYFRYRVYLKTNDQNFTPTLSNIAVTFTNGCTPPGQVFFPGISAGTYDIEVTKSGYNPATTTLDITGYTSSTVRLFKTI